MAAIGGALARVFGRNAFRARLATVAARTSGALRAARVGAVRAARPTSFRNFGYRSAAFRDRLLGRRTLNNVKIPQNLNKGNIWVRLKTGEIQKPGSNFPKNWPGENKAEFGYNHDPVNNRMINERHRGLLTDADYSSKLLQNYQHYDKYFYKPIYMTDYPKDVPLDRNLPSPKQYNRLRSMLDAFKKTPGSERGPAGQRIRQLLDRGPLKNLSIPSNVRNLPTNVKVYLKNLYNRLRMWFRNVRGINTVPKGVDLLWDPTYDTVLTGERTPPIEGLLDRETLNRMKREPHTPLPPGTSYFRDVPLRSNSLQSISSRSSLSSVQNHPVVSASQALEGAKKSRIPTRIKRGVWNVNQNLKVKVANVKKGAKSKIPQFSKRVKRSSLAKVSTVRDKLINPTIKIRENTTSIPLRSEVNLRGIPKTNGIRETGTIPKIRVNTNPIRETSFIKEKTPITAPGRSRALANAPPANIPDVDLYERDPPNKRNALGKSVRNLGRRLNQQVKVSASYLKPKNTKSISRKDVEPRETEVLNSKGKKKGSKNSFQYVRRALYHPGLYSKKD